MTFRQIFFKSVFSKEIRKIRCLMFILNENWDISHDALCCVLRAEALYHLGAINDVKGKYERFFTASEQGVESDSDFEISLLLQWQQYLKH